MSLTKKTISGLIWTFGQQFSVQLINFIETIILAGLLLPAEFGIIGMLTIFMTIGYMLMDSGLTSSLIRTPNADEKDYSTVFFINLAGSIIIYILLFFLAPFIANFYHQPILAQVIRVYTLIFIIRAFSSIQLTKLTKEMNFKLLMLIQIPSEVLGSILGIILAWQGFGVWSLVWMNVFQAIILALQLWFRTGWKPHFFFNKELFKYHFNFGYKLTLSGLLDSVYQNSYTLIIGKFFSAAQLGYYTYALTFRQLPIQNISSALDKVTYPVFSTIQHDEVKLKAAYQKLMKQVLFWIAPSLIVLSVIAKPLFNFLLTEKWLPAVPYFQILCIAGIIYPLNVYNLNILKVKGRSDLFFKLDIIKKSYSVIGIFCALPFGIYGLLYFQLISDLIGFIINSVYSGKLINYSLKEQVKDILPILILATLVGGVIWLFNQYIITYLSISTFIQLFIVGFSYFILYLTISYLIKMTAFDDFSKLILKRQTAVNH